MEEEKTIKVLTTWGRIKYAIISSFLLFASISWLYALATDSNMYNTGSDYTFAIFMMIGLGVGGLALMARVFNKTLSGIIKGFFHLEPVKTTTGVIKALLKVALIIGGVCLVIAIAGGIIVALGPLWIIVILLFLIFLAVAGR